MFPTTVRGLKEQLAQPLGKAEVQFLIKTFQYACMFFFGFGFLTFLAGSVVIQISGSGFGWVGTVLCSLIGFLLYFPLNFYAMKYKNDPVAADSKLVTTAFTILACTFFFLFMGVIGVLGNIVSGPSSTTIGWLGKMIAFVFGITLVIYAIPLGIAFQIQKKSTILNLNKFLNFCGFSYIAFFVILLLLSFAGGFVTGAGSWILFLLSAIMLFVSPIITLYRMRSIVPYINHNDPIERKRWEHYFAFEISFQLLQLAWYIARIVATLVNGRSTSRLQ
ncbi:hypothetical protein A6V39_01825 [Candidatus Mycoplasma haematobovis]|uniref:Uncharacterized protein n=1 Tax=Candidatus Mycoplasma haematobovis TaxID=432608 RepID=A0A1A9QE07_9MOLU|nr:hypothetical protein [Candidatus Mycoplasma haematobovis]OAL10175.1 hypothetical protein A6V39_01825 [Candidatus Mycoplasma haematobovis]